MSERAHSIFAPSSSHRWLECIQSVRELENLPPETPNQAAIDGTDAHWVAEQCFSQKKNAIDFVGQRMPSNAKCNRAMARAVQIYLDYVRLHHNANRGKLYIEQRLQMPKIDARLFGSSDAILVTQYKTLHVFDFKHGLWLVEADGNTQMMLYALGALTKFKNELDLSKPVTAHICQTRAEHKSGTCRAVKFSIDELIKFGNLAKAKIKTYDDPNAPFVEGEHCLFCRREFFCPQRNKIGRKVFT